MRGRTWLPSWLVLLLAAPLSMLAAVTWVGAHGWFGHDDLFPFGFWSCVLLLPLSLSFRVLAPLLPARTRLTRTALGSSLGVVSGILSTFAVAIGMGPMIMAFSFPILWIWGGAAGVAAGIAALLAPATPMAIGTSPMVWRAGIAVAGYGLTAATPILWLLGSMFLWGRGSEDLYFLPEAFAGPVFVLYDQPSAPPIPSVDGVRQLRIPNSGILVTSSPLSEGWKNPTVYLASSNGPNPVRTDWSHSDTTTAGDRAFWLPTRISGGMPGGRRVELRYEAFVVGRRDDDRRFEARADTILDSLWTIYAQ